MTALRSSPEDRSAVLFDVTRYDRSPNLSSDERKALHELRRKHYLLWGPGTDGERAHRQHAVARLTAPIYDSFKLFQSRRAPSRASDLRACTIALLRQCLVFGCAYWAWSAANWVHVLGRTREAFNAVHGQRQSGHMRVEMIAVSYVTGCFSDVVDLGKYRRESLASRVFDPLTLKLTIQRVQELLSGWGYACSPALRITLVESLLRSRSPRIEDVTVEVLEGIRQRTPSASSFVYQIGRVLAHLQIVPSQLPRRRGGESWSLQFTQATQGIDPAWLEWTARWYSTSTLEPKTRRTTRVALWKAGRWLAAHHPNVREPSAWDRELALSFVAAATRFRVGDYSGRTTAHDARAGKPLAARSIDHIIIALRRFFLDCHEWSWIPYRFDPHRILVTPRSVRAKIGPDPRVIMDAPWAKLLWAGLNLSAEDLAAAKAGRCYPLELYRALAVVWLFSGLRSDEIVRLRAGCIRWERCQPTGSLKLEETEGEEMCLLHVPTHKTGRSYVKPVDAVVGKAIEEWEAVRGDQPKLLDRRTGEIVSVLLCYRGRALSAKTINASVIPTLCQKARVPREDARGRITSHRARATMATQLYNSRQPMSIFDLQKWLGHDDIRSTLSYVALTPTKLARAYNDAGYFSRNVRTVEVLIDQDAIRDATAATGLPWRYYDLGHGLCSYDFFDQCPHRMACARCDFYLPKESAAGQFAGAKRNLLRMLQEIPLTDDERAAVDGDLVALENLTKKLRGKPVPSKAADPHNESQQHQSRTERNER